MTWKFMQIAPQKAKGVLKASYWTAPEWLAEEKYDGDRRIAQFCGHIVRFTGTRESVDGTGFVEKTSNLPHLQIPARAIKGLTGTALDGEIVPPHGKTIKGGRSKYVTSIMGSKPEEAIRKQIEGGHLCYVVFDCLWYKGLDIRGQNLKARRVLAEQAVREWGNAYVSMARQATGARKRAFYDLVIRGGGEGVVLKRFDHTYGDRTLWVKVKAQSTADVVVMGFEPGKGKYKGSVGAIIFGQYRYRCGKLTLDRCGTCRGFTDEEMEEFALHPKKYVNQAIEITHNGREPTGSFRHPRFSRFRDDKDPYDCVWHPEET